MRIASHCSDPRFVISFRYGPASGRLFWSRSWFSEQHASISVHIEGWVEEVIESLQEIKGIEGGRRRGGLNLLSEPARELRPREAVESRLPHALHGGIAMAAVVSDDVNSDPRVCMNSLISICGGRCLQYRPH